MSAITLPYNWRPREYQMPLWEVLEGGCKRAIAIWHRRAGKDYFAINWTSTQAMKRRGLYWHVLPTYKQGRKIVWDGMTKDGRPFRDAFPKSLVLRERDDEMTCWLRGGSVWQVVGSDQADSLVGANPVGVVFSEFSIQDIALWNLVRPILAENGGWALFIYTPRGRNHGYRLYKQALENAVENDGGKWFAQLLTVDDTHTIPLDAIEDDRKSGMPEELIQQEYWCSFDAPLVGSYYGDLISTARREGRITNVPYVGTKPVETWWDLGMGDATAIGWVQQVNSEVRFIDYHENQGKGLDFYAARLFERDWPYKEHVLPHDANVRELGTGRSRLEMLRSLGIGRVRVAPKLSLEDGIAATRMLLQRAWFDEKRCEKLIDALSSYSKQYDSKREIYLDTPLHNWASHGADMVRTGAVGHRVEKKRDDRPLYPKLAIV